MCLFWDFFNKANYRSVAFHKNSILNLLSNEVKLRFLRPHLRFTLHFIYPWRNFHASYCSENEIFTRSVFLKLWLNCFICSPLLTFLHTVFGWMGKCPAIYFTTMYTNKFYTRKVYITHCKFILSTQFYIFLLYYFLIN